MVSWAFSIWYGGHYGQLGVLGITQEGDPYDVSDLVGIMPGAIMVNLLGMVQSGVIMVNLIPLGMVQTGAIVMNRAPSVWCVRRGAAWLRRGDEHRQ